MGRGYLGVMVIPLDPQRRAALLELKLGALVRGHLGCDVDGTGAKKQTRFGRGAALVAGGTVWVLLDDQPERGLGAAMAWMQRQTEARELALITEAASGILTRRAELFTTPISVWHAVDRLLVPGVAEPYPPQVMIDPAHEPLRELIEQAGAEPVEEYGVLAGEVRGLEVCRAITDQHTGEVRLEVGVGAHDREAFLMLHGARPTVEALADVVRIVCKHRELGADHHPLNRLGAERLLRWLSIADPARLGAARLEPAAPPIARANLKDPVPCVAVGWTLAGNPLVAVYSTGIDLDLVPFAVDAREMHSPHAELVLVVPERDASPVTRALAQRATKPPTVAAWS